MKRRISAFMLIITILSTLCGVTVCAVEPRYSYTTTATSTLYISSNTAYCKSKARGKTTATKIEAVQYLEKKSGSKWYVVTDGTWTDSVNDSLLIVSNNKSGLTSGTYRVRTVFTVYSGSKSEKSYCDQQGSNDLTQIFFQGRPRQMRSVSVSGLLPDLSTLNEHKHRGILQ